MDSHLETKSNMAVSNEDEEKQIRSAQDSRQENLHFQQQVWGQTLPLAFLFFFLIDELFF